MLETEEVDDDYFTPASSTSLANIFGGSAQKETVNDSLKYTPPKKHVPQNICETKLEDSKVTECVFACALTAYEWADNNYSDRGKVGFAIVKIVKTNSHNIVIYNSNKVTLSRTPVTSKLNITVKGNNYICFYDIFFKYWSLNAKEDDIKKITDVLSNLGVDIKQEGDTDQKCPDPSCSESEKTLEENVKSDKESDTDSSAMRKTKISILNRMANMGHSVLPPNTNTTEKSSDSSDTTDTINISSKLPRHKPGKTALKRLNTDKNTLPENSQIIQTKVALPFVEQQITTPSVYGVSGQFVPVTNANIITSFANHEMTLFMSEQRMNNNELRININRTTDKVDQILDKVKDLEQAVTTKPQLDTQTSLMQKLLAEYENKIKAYEQLLTNTKHLDEKLFISAALDSRSTTDSESYKNQILELRRVINEKENEISKLTEKINNNELGKVVSSLKESLALKTQELENVCKQLKEQSNDGVARSSDFDSKIKETMNDLYRVIAVNFNNNETYSGETIKNTIARVIKKVTMQSLSEPNP